MKIERNLNGKKYLFFLTEKELISAYLEQQDKFDEDDIVSYLNELSDSDLLHVCGVTRKDAFALVPDMAAEMRRMIDKYDVSWEYARSEAVAKYLPPLNKPAV